MKSARLITTLKCNNSCAGCCNKDWKGEKPTKVKPTVLLSGFDEVLITGGEPMLFPGKVDSMLCHFVTKNPNLRRIVYTTAPDYYDVRNLGFLMDGLTITLHTNDDVERYNIHNQSIYTPNVRVNIFHKDILIPVYFNKKHYYKYVEWIKDCPLPANETLCMLDPLWR